MDEIICVELQTAIFRGIYREAGSLLMAGLVTGILTGDGSNIAGGVVAGMATGMVAGILAMNMALYMHDTTETDENTDENTDEDVYRDDGKGYLYIWIGILAAVLAWTGIISGFTIGIIGLTIGFILFNIKSNKSNTQFDISRVIVYAVLVTSGAVLSSVAAGLAAGFQAADIGARFSIVGSLVVVTTVGGMAAVNFE